MYTSKFYIYDLHLNELRLLGFLVTVPVSQSTTPKIHECKTLDRAVKQSDHGKTSKTCRPGLPAISDQMPRIWSSISFFYLTSGVKLG